MMSDVLSEKVFRFTEEKGLLPSSGRVLVGVSGGADSVTLLSLLRHWPRPGLCVAAVHVHHGIRGAEADWDADFVRRICREWNVPLFLVHADVPAVAARERMGLEEAGRAVRYAVFERIAREWGADRIATAHTASDRAETVLMHLMRGCGVSGLSGIPVQQGRIVCPLLSCTRSEIEAYCRRNTLPYVTDSTNHDLRFTRNAVRREVLPAMEKHNPAVSAALVRLADAAAEDEACLAQLAAAALQEAQTDSGIRRRVLLRYPKAIRYRMLQQALAEQGCRSMERLHFEAVDQSVLRGGGGECLPGGWKVQVTDRWVTVGRSAPPVTAPPSPVSPDPLPFTGIWDGRPFCVRLVNTADTETAKNVHRMFFKFAVDYDKILNDLNIRARAPGDRLHPAGRGVGKSVRRLMQECSVPAAQRDRFPLLCDGAGIVLLPGITCADRVRLTEDSRHFLVWEWAGESS